MLLAGKSWCGPGQHHKNSKAGLLHPGVALWNTARIPRLVSLGPGETTRIPIWYLVSLVLSCEQQTVLNVGVQQVLVGSCW